MTPDKIHSTARLVMWGSVGVAGIAVLLILPGNPFWGFAIFILSCITAITAGVIKKIYCPRCRGGSNCDLKPPEKN